MESWDALIPDFDCDGVSEGVRVAVLVREPVRVGELERVAVTETVDVTELEIEDEGVPERLAVSDADGVPDVLVVCVSEGDTLGVAVALGLGSWLDDSLIV